MGPKRIQTPYNLFCGLRGKILYNSLIRQSSSLSPKFPSSAHSCHLAITPEGCSKKQSNVLSTESMALLFGQRYGTAWAGLKGKHRHWTFPSKLQSLWSTTRLLQEEVLPLLWYRLSSRIKKFLMVCKLWAQWAVATIVFMWKWNHF